jgi:hypothetical protein
LLSEYFGPRRLLDPRQGLFRQTRHLFARHAQKVDMVAAALGGVIEMAPETPHAVDALNAV